MPRTLNRIHTRTLIFLTIVGMCCKHQAFAVSGSLVPRHRTLMTNFPNPIEPQKRKHNKGPTHFFRGPLPRGNHCRSTRTLASACGPGTFRRMNFGCNVAEHEGVGILILGSRVRGPGLQAFRVPCDLQLGEEVTSLGS